MDTTQTAALPRTQTISASGTPAALAAGDNASPALIEGLGGFMDLILAHLTAALTENGTGSGKAHSGTLSGQGSGARIADSTGLPASTALFSGLGAAHVSLLAEKIAAFDPANLIPDSESSSFGQFPNIKASLSGMASSLLSGIPENFSPDFESGEMSSEEMLSGLAALIALPLSPREMTTLLAAGKQGDSGNAGSATGADRITDMDALFVHLQNSFGDSADLSGAAQDPGIPSDFQMSLSSLMTGVPRTSALTPQGASSATSLLPDPLLPSSSGLSRILADGDSALSTPEEFFSPPATKGTNTGAENAAQTGKPSVSAPVMPSATAESGHTAQTSNPAQTQLIWSQGGGWDSLSGGGASLGTNAEGMGVFTLSGTGSLTPLSVHAPHAATPHPTSQMVAVTVQGLASRGENRTLTLHLDPPDLGRMDIRVEFGTEKSLRAVMIVEKPETLLMLQRDSHLLDKALQNAGLETGETSLDFELAQNGHFSSREDSGRDDGTSRAGGAQSSDGDPGDDLDTVIGWLVDPQTGLTRYNILV